MKIRWLNRLALLAMAGCLALGTAGCGAAGEKQETGSEVQASKDGTYTPKGFTFSGGTGRVTITCPKYTLKGGSATAQIVFSSPHYTYVKVDGRKYDAASNSDDQSVFEVPVKLDTDMELIGCTTAMSTPHEVTYTIHIRTKDDGNGPASDSSASTSAKGHTPSDGGSNARWEKDAKAWKEGSAPEIAGLTYDHAMKLDYAKEFGVFYYEGGYRVLDVYGGYGYLVVPEGQKVPDQLPDGMKVIEQPADHIYLAGTSAMALFDAIDSLDCITLSGTQADGWYVEGAKKAMEAGRIAFAGKYSAPDYELLVDSGCDLAIESTMILHTPEVAEKLTKLHIPVLVDRSSYEPTALGRTEWVKLYGALLGREDAAETFFEEEAERSGVRENYGKTGKSVVFFTVNSDDQVMVRSGDDYIAAMIEQGGGTYLFGDLKRSGQATVTISMEEFYAKAKDADYLIYNSTIEKPLAATGDLADKNALFQKFRAVREGHVWQTSANFYQRTDIVSEFTRDVHRMLTGEDAGEMTFLTQVK